MKNPDDHDVAPEDLKHLKADKEGRPGQA